MPRHFYAYFWPKASNMSISVEKISKFYGEQKALNQISFSIEKGEQVTDASIYGESKAFAQSAQSGAIEAKPETPKLIKKDKPENEEDIPF